MKRVLTIALMSLFGFTFGCGGAATPEVAEAGDAEGVVEEVAEEVVDGMEEAGEEVVDEAAPEAAEAE